MIGVARTRRIEARVALAVEVAVRVRETVDAEAFVACAAGDGLAGNFLDVMQDGGNATRCDVPVESVVGGRS